MCHRPTLHNFWGKIEETTYRLKVPPYRLHGQARSMRQSFWCPVYPFCSSRVGGIRPSLILSSRFSDSFWCIILIGNNFFSYSWHILTVLELCLTRKCQMALNHQLLNIQEQYYIRNRIMYVLIKGLCWYLGNLGIPQSPPQLCLDNLYGLRTLLPPLLLLLYL